MARIALRTADQTSRNEWLHPSDDGTLIRQRVWFTRRFGYNIGDITPEPGRYRVIGLIRCGWNRRIRIARRLLGLEDALHVESVSDTADTTGWRLQPGGLGDRFGFTRLADFYERTDPTYRGRGTSPAVIDEQTGRVVSNNYHTLTLDLETVWRPYWRPGAPDLYPVELRTRIDLLNQQLFDDVNNGTYKILRARTQGATLGAYHVFKARLEDLDYRLASRRYLFGPVLTDSDIRLFQTLGAYETMYRPGIQRKLGDAESVVHVWSFPHLWAYARDLFQTPGFMDEEERYVFGFTPDEHGEYSPRVANIERLDDGFGGRSEAGRPEYLERWLEPANRERLSGDEWYSGPGTAGLEELWQFGRHIEPVAIRRTDETTPSCTI